VRRAHRIRPANEKRLHGPGWCPDISMLALRIIIRKSIRKDKQTFIGFVDIENVFDNVDWNV